jgi:RNA polymerase sigma-70 factor (ECF subfamily)
MSTESEDFAALVARGRQGDQEALAQLAQQYEPKVRLVARVLLGPALRPYLDSVDLVQSVHRSLLLGLREEQFDFSNPDKLIALALTVVRRKVARHWRRLRRQQRLDGRASEGGDLAQLLTSLSSPQGDPALAAQFNDQIRHLCADLSETERRMLDLRLQGYSTAEIAGQLGLNPVALRVRLTRLRQRLQVAGVLDDWL